MREIPLKTPAELDTMRAAGRLAADVLRRVSAAVAPGVTTRDLDNLARTTMEILGVRSAFLGYMGYPAQCCISVNETVIHGIPDDRRIQDGDIVSVDVGIWHEGFAGDNALTVMVGKCGPDVERLVSKTEAALLAGIAACRAGSRLGDVSHAVETVAVANRLSVVREFVGHGIGRALHEEPQVSNFGPSSRGPLLKPGMVLCLEPMFNLGARAVRTLSDGWTVVARDGLPAAHFEHMVAITAAGPEILTPRPALYQHLA
jgi:methionyl aminopeptidase